MAVFPGYLAFPGGKVEKDDLRPVELKELSKYPKDLMWAIEREVNEEIGISFFNLFESDEVLSFQLLAKTVSPDFNPYQFETFFFILRLNLFQI